MSCLMASTYVMEADIYEQTTTQSRSGAVVRGYPGLPTRTIKCRVRGSRGGGVNALGSAERFGNEYSDLKVLRLNCAEPISQRSQVRNIRLDSGVKPWGDDEFEVTGYTPLLDPFGQAVVEYEVTLEKV